MSEEKLQLLAAFCLFEAFRAEQQNVKLTENELQEALQSIAEDEGADEEISFASQSNIADALTELEGKGYVYAYRYPYTKTRYIITTQGAEAWSNPPDTSQALMLYRHLGDDWLIEALSNLHLDASANDKKNVVAEKVVTIATNEWEPLPLDRQNPVLDQSIVAIEDLATAVAQDNGYAATEPDERNYILSALRNGASALKDQSKIYRLQFRAYIWEPLTKLAERFGPSAIGLLATAAKELIKEGLKHAAKSWWN